jgi:hypothetical protein
MKGRLTKSQRLMAIIAISFSFFVAEIAGGLNSLPRCVVSSVTG